MNGSSRELKFNRLDGGSTDKGGGRGKGTKFRL